MLCALWHGAPAQPPLDFSQPFSKSGADSDVPAKPLRPPFSPGGKVMKRFGMVLLAVALCVAAARPAMAQGSWRYGFSAGALLPMGGGANYSTGDKMGF